MSVTIAHRPHVKVPWLPIIVVLAVVAAAALVAALIIESSETTPAPTQAQVLGVAGTATAADVPKNRSAAARAVIIGGAPPAALVEEPAESRKNSHVPWAAGEGGSSGK